MKNNDNVHNVTSEISNRINKGNKCCYGFRYMWRRAFLNKDATRKIDTN
jgi:hypothetical protein